MASKRFAWRRKLCLSVAVMAGLAAAAPAASAQTAPTRAQVQHLLRRFSFSASPEEVTAVQAQGIPAWLAQQLAPDTIDDSGTILETLPTSLKADGSYEDYNVFERAVLQHMILTKRQLQAKMELHWLDHFAVGLQKVGDPAIMYHYDQTIRQYALGNFAQLLIAVSKEPAMLVWLDNNNNAGSQPNENFARELMQLYSTGLYKLNLDGSIQVNTSNLPIPAYRQVDVEGLAKAMTGYGVVVDNTNTNPQTRFSVTYYPANHYTGPLTFFNQPRTVPNDQTAIDFVCNLLARNPSTAPFMATELLQRFVTEKPSKKYISDIATVWQANVRAPDQIAKVVAAIVNHPEFNNAYRGMAKQPVEYVIDALRALPGRLQAQTNTAPANNLLYPLNNLGQQLFYPESVFSFYRPGALNALVNTQTMLTRTWVTKDLVNATPDNTYVDTYFDIAALRARVGKQQIGSVFAAYLADALIDGGTADQQLLVKTYIGNRPTDTQLRGAIWLLLNAPDYGVN